MRVLAGLAVTLAAAVEATYWLEEIPHRGRSPYYPDTIYQVFRNVRDYGAVGDGGKYPRIPFRNICLTPKIVTDDTAAINAAVADGVRCIPGVCTGSTISPATVYFPSGTYLISDSIIDYYYTQMIGDPTSRPIIKAASSFNIASVKLIEANPYLLTGLLAWNSTNNFFRQIRNFVIDTTALPPDFPVIGIHWPSAQATSISNCAFYLSNVPGNRHTGLFIENGSGGLLNDLYFYGGGNASVLGNQQYTARNLWFENADVAIHMPWDWGWTYKSMVFNNCRIGIQMDKSASVGSITLLDSLFENVDTAISTTRTTGDAGSIGTTVMENVYFQNVNGILVGPSGVDNVPPFPGHPGQNDIIIMGHYVGSDGRPMEKTGYYQYEAPRSPYLLDSTGRYFERSKPQYEGYSAQQFMSAKGYGAYGDANHDDTEALNSLFSYTASRGLVAYLDAGIYMVTNTIFIPPNAKIVGEALASIIMAVGSNFGDANDPRPVVQVGNPGDAGQIEWSDTIVSTRGTAPGAILIQYNLKTAGLPSGMWDVHARIGGAAGTYLQAPDCSTYPGKNEVNPNCMAAYMSMHITSYAGGLYVENCWFWVADHDLENQEATKVAVFAGRGLLVEAQGGPVWLSATASEHHVLYQYQFVNTNNIYVGHAQTEQAYFQPIPPASYPFAEVPQLYDPDFSTYCQSDPVPGCNMGWGMRILNSTNVVVYGVGLYSFFNNYDDSCASNKSPAYCQERTLAVDGQVAGTKILGLSTVGTRIMVERNGVDVVAAAWNNDTFADTLGLYEP